MATTFSARAEQGARAATRSEAAHQAYEILHWGFVALPVIAGADKFFHLLGNWNQYLAPAIAKILPFGPNAFMLAVGVIEVAAGVLVALKPKVGAYVVAAWLGGIILNLLVGGRFLDIALRDFGLMLGALALGRLAAAHEEGTA